MSNVVFKFEGKSQSPAKIEGRSRGFKVVVDEPPEFGGENSAPNPVEYVLAGYAGCLNVMAHLIAKERNLPIENLSISLEGDLNPARVFGQSFDERAGFQTISAVIEVDSSASQPELDDWLAEVERRCPVNDNLSNPTPTHVIVRARNTVADLAV